MEVPMTKDVDKDITDLIFPELLEVPPFKYSKLVKELGSTTAPILYNSLNIGEGDLNKDELGRQRYRGPVAEVLTADPQLSLGWGLMKLIWIRKEGLANYNSTVQRYRLEDIMKQTEWKKLLSKAADTAKKGWRKGDMYVVDLATLAGYAEALVEDELNEQAKEWFGYKKVRSYDGLVGTEDEWLEDLKVELVQYLRSIWAGRTVDASVSISDYAKNPMYWGTTGASLYTKNANLSANFNGHTFKAKRTKWLEALLLNPSIIENSMKTRKRMYNKIVQKRETKKSRGVVSSDLETYWKMDYFMQLYVDQLNIGVKDSTLWMTPEQTRQFWLEFSDYKDLTIRMPIDQTAFDQNQTQKMIQKAMDALREVMDEHVTGEFKTEVLWMVELAKYAIEKGYVEVDGRRVPYKNGILSGWRMTAWLDTILNIAVLKLVENKFFKQGTPLVSNVAQGDDLQLRLKTWIGCGIIRAAIESFGFIVNPSKFFASDKRDEFLRKYSVPNLVTGYPARTINALLWRNPVNAPISPGLDRINEMVEQWHILINRFELQWYDIWDLMVPDIARANNTDYKTVESIALTPQALGGCGVVGPRLPRITNGMSILTSKMDGYPLVNWDKLSGYKSIITEASVLTKGITLPSDVNKWAKGVIVWNKWRDWTEVKAYNVKIPYIEKDKFIPIRQSYFTARKWKWINALWSGIDRTYLLDSYLSMAHNGYYDFVGEKTVQSILGRNASKAFSNEYIAQSLKIPFPKIAGYASGWWSGFMNTRMTGSLADTLLRFRRPNMSGWEQIRLRVETELAVTTNQMLTSLTGGIVVRD
jgi:hypothetical protein